MSAVTERVQQLDVAPDQSMVGREELEAGGGGQQTRRGADEKNVAVQEGGRAGRNQRVARGGGS